MAYADAFAGVKAGTIDQAAVDAMPQRWKDRLAEAGLLSRGADGFRLKKSKEVQ